MTQGAIFQNTGQYGGGIHNEGKLTLKQSNVYGNRGTTNAGGLYATELILFQSSVYSNSAGSTHGGGIWGATFVSLDQSSVLSNTAAGSGGGIIYGTTVVMTDSTIAGNTAASNGGGMWKNGNVTLTRVTFARNRAVNGGAIYHDAGNLNATASTVNDNVATTSGGGIYVRTGTVTLLNSIFARNAAQAATGGGGIYLAAGTTFNGTNATFTNNSAPSGGGFYNLGSVALTSSSLASNVATSNGAGVYNQGVLSVTTSTFQSNNATGDGGALYNAGTVTLTQSAIIQNSANAGGGAVRNADAGAIYLVNSTVGENRAGTGGGVYNTGGIDARFVTIYKNDSTTGGLSIYNQPAAGKQFAIFGVIAAKPGNENRNVCSGAALVDAGPTYSRISDASCGPAASANIQLRDLVFGIGATPFYLPVAVANNSVLDVVPTPACEAQLGVGNLIDQRSRPRPLRFPEHANVFCDAGAIEYGQELHYVCGAPLDQNNFPARCQYLTVASALAEAATEDTVIISGIVTETVTVTKSVVIRGPSLDELTPGTHMGFVQASRTAPAGNCNTAIGSVFTIANNAQVEMRDLNIRNGCADRAAA